MSPQDKVERVLKEIHIAFSKGEPISGHPEKITLNRKEFLALLDRLNQGIYDMMDQYEQTRQSRQNAERAFKKKGEEIIDEANSSAEDIYAASVIYTADMLGRIRDLMDETNESMNDLFRQFRKNLKDEKDRVKAHETELQSQLHDLSDTQKYLSIIQEMNREKARQKRDLEAEKAAGSAYAKKRYHTGASKADVKVNEEYFEKAGKPIPTEQVEEESPVASVKPDIKINTDAEYFRWKAQQENGEVQDAVTQASVEDDFEASKMDEGNLSSHPTEEEIRRAVLQDEDALLFAGEEKPGKKNRQGNGRKILKSLIFGDD